MKEFFHNLKEIRQKKGISLEDISKRCKLSIKYLQEIEKGTLENLPRGYDRIFFKRYLKEIGEDKEDVWRDFDLFFGNSPMREILPENEREEKKQGEREPAGTEEKGSFWQEISFRLNMDKLHKYFWIAVTVIVLSVVGYFAYQQYLFVKNNPLQIEEISISDHIKEMQEQDSLLTPQMSENTRVDGTDTLALTVELRAVHRTWIREIRDGKDTTEYILPAKLRRTIQANQRIQFMLGRADGVELWLNGQNLGIMGQEDEVVLRLVVDENGISQKRLKQVKKETKTPESDTLQTEQNQIVEDTSEAE